MLAGPANPVGRTAPAVSASAAWTADASSVPPGESQLDGTDNPPILLDEAKVADIPPPVLLLAPRAPRCRPANCGVGYQAPEPAVVPMPLNVC